MARSKGWNLKLNLSSGVWVMVISSLFTALSGLRTSASKLQTSANNLANLQTPGFKKSRVEIGDVASVWSLLAEVRKPDNALKRELMTIVHTPDNELSFRLPPAQWQRKHSTWAVMKV